MDMVIDILAQIGGVLFLFGGAIWITVQFAWGLIVAVFWAAVGLFALLLVCATIVGIVRPAPPADRTSSTSSVDVVKSAMRAGEFDAEIGRVVLRNQQRGRL